MYTPFESLSAESRVWIYQAGRKFTVAEMNLVSQYLKEFCEQWAAHGQPLKSSFKIEKEQFVVMAVDEDFHHPSGCSIDSSVGVMRQIYQATGVDLLDRSRVPVIQDDAVQLVPIHELKSRFQQGLLKSQTIILNTLVATKAELQHKWEIPAEKSWMVKYLPKTTLSA